MSNRFATNNKALAECDIRGFRYKLKELEFVKPHKIPSRIDFEIVNTGY